MGQGFIDRRLQNNWDKQLEEGLPDSRLNNREKGRVMRARMWWEPVYCASCGVLKGLITADWCPHVFYVCDPCAAKAAGPPPGMIEGPPPSGMIEVKG